MKKKIKNKRPTELRRSLKVIYREGKRITTWELRNDGSCTIDFCNDLRPPLRGQDRTVYGIQCPAFLRVKGHVKRMLVK